MRMRGLWLLLPAMALAYTCCAQADAGSREVPATTGSHKVEIHIRPTFNGQPLKLENQYYINDHGDTLYIDAFRFYMTNISIGKGIATNSHLFDAEDTATYHFSITNAAMGDTAILYFLAGVDSIANTSGANDGDLDPVKGMYWAWNSGYIMAKLEGHSNVCHTLHHAFEFHIGGYMPPYNTARQVALSIWPQQVNTTQIPVIYLDADVAAWFRNIDLAQVNSILIPGKDAAMMANNYAQMFSINHVSVILQPAR